MLDEAESRRSLTLWEKILAKVILKKADDLGLPSLYLWIGICRYLHIYMNSILKNLDKSLSCAHAVLGGPFKSSLMKSSSQPAEALINTEE